MTNLFSYYFVEIEKLVRHLLPNFVVQGVMTSTTTTLDELIQKVVDNEDVQFMWTILSPSITSNEDSIELLYEIVNLWTTVRGFSLAATWMETYKMTRKETKQKSTGLRKHLS